MRIGGLRSEWPVVGLVFLVGAVYARTLLPGIHQWGDITKAQFLGKFLGMTHPTGYPLYILLTAPIARVPIGSLAWRINAFSAICGLAAVVLTYGIARQQRVRPILAAIVAGALAFSKTAWSQFVVAEVYALNALLVAGVLFLLLRWLHTGNTKWFLAACGVYALSFGNHLTMVTLLPAFAMATILGPWRRILRPSIVGVVALFIALGAAQYGYLFLASSSNSLYLEYRIGDFGELVEFVSGERYRRRMFAFDWKESLTARLPRFVAQLVRDLGPLALLAPLGLTTNKTATVAGAEGVRLARADVVLLLAAVGQLVWLIGYDIRDIEVYAIPLTLIVAVFAGQALETIASESTDFWAPSLAVAIGVSALFPLPFVNRPSHVSSARFVERIEENLSVMGRDAVILDPIYYSPRMAYVYRLYADRLFEEKNLHLSDHASVSQVVRYLNGEPTLVDSHTREMLPTGLRLFVAPRGAEKDWGRDLSLGNRQGELRDVTLSQESDQ